MNIYDNFFRDNKSNFNLKLKIESYCPMSLGFSPVSRELIVIPFCFSL